MKVLLLSDQLDVISKSGLGQAISHQMKALESAGVEYTLSVDDDYDLIHINTVFPESFLAALNAKKEGIKVIYHAHSTEEDFRNSFVFSNQVAPLFKTWLTTCYKSANLILTPTPYAKRLLENYGLNKKIIAVSNGVELEKFKQDKEAGHKFREEFSFSKDDKIIMSVGLYIERKGIIDFVELAKRMPEYKFIWFGYLNLNGVPYKVREAVETKLPNLYFPGYIPQQILKSAYSGADLFLFPTYEETEGIVLLEALATKIPVLIRDIPIYEEWLEDSKNVYKASNNEEFEAKIRGILEGTLKDLTEEGYLVAKERSIEEVGLQLKKIYEEVLNEKN